ncbi:uncharacterized protein MONBRDRAFT_26446 [Monosiga brevicollis MX1]|uniref:Gelsolin-like domain-containing protein n=1 Tax=Monosiga brevicollis TaxID=81824 RepID=A9V2E0_MONBE|nr:uncharacterized protein MONBRDRAFT_26446 [Monosiga brevicollis MX1]EDQ88360.1 predicted protein [Monosiga brevicollis MX1]|eukprot:XP_001746953.1 hypothetical protein [Monosiga brevicollis MX1]
MAVRAAAGQFDAPIGASGGPGRKGRSYDLANTNIGNLGTDLEKAVRQAAAEHEEAWKNAGDKPGIEIWRIEQFKVVPWPKKSYGKFYSGDSYIVLHTYRKNGVGAKNYDVHFWIGKDSTQDEYGTAAYKTVELDDLLGGIPTQYREVQGKESRRFKKLFKRLIFMEGGADSGFNHVEEKTYRPRLLQCKGKMHVVCREVPLSYKSLNAGDSFIYDGGDRIFIWNGREAGAMEKAKASNLAQALDDERGGKPHREVFDQDGRNLKEWWHAIGGEGTVMSAEEGGSDEDVKPEEKRLLRVSDSSGRLKMDLVATGEQVVRSLLNPSDVMILDDGMEVMVWVGQGASIAERKNALNFAVEYLKQYNKPLDSPIARYMDGGENDAFEAAFEQGVMSMARPGDGNVKFSANISKFQGHTKAVGQSMMGSYQGSGGPGVTADLDAAYAVLERALKVYCTTNAIGHAEILEQIPAHGKAAELQAAGAGAYDPKSGWVSGLSAEQRAARDSHIAELERDHKSGKYSKAGALGTSLSGGRLGDADDRRPTITTHSEFDVDKDTKAVRKAIKGWGTNEKTLIRIFGRRTQKERDQIRVQYSNLFDRDLIKDLDDDTSGNFAKALVALARKAVERDAHFLHRAFKGFGNDNEMLIDILCTKNTQYLREVNTAYKTVTGDRMLVEDITGNTNGHYRKVSASTFYPPTGPPALHHACLPLLEHMPYNVFAYCCASSLISPTLPHAPFAKTRSPDGVSVNQAAVEADAEALYKAGEKRWGTNEDKFVEIFTERSYAQLAAIFQEYSKLCKYDIRESIKREMSGNLKKGLQTIVDVVRDPLDFYTTKIYESMHGLGTNNTHLIELLIERSEVDLEAIKERFQQKYGKTLLEMFDSETAIRWNYRRLLTAIINEGDHKELYDEDNQ